MIRYPVRPSAAFATAARVAISLAALAGCGATVAPGDGAVGADGSVDATLPDGAAACRLPNGSLCAVGQTCPAGDGCNTCACSAGGGLACTERACVDAGACGPMDARGEGACDLFLGVVWTGTACNPVSGCRCVGADCPRLFRDSASCFAAYAACVPGATTCTLPGGTCATGLACLGQMNCTTASGLCVPTRPCTRDAAQFCGCDGVTFTTSSTCPNQNYQYMGACRAPMGDGGLPGCTTSTDCPPSTVCEGMGCGTPNGTCVPTDRPCTADFAPFCGCDGTTFNSSSSCPNRRYARRGPC